MSGDGAKINREEIESRNRGKSRRGDEFTRREEGEKILNGNGREGKRRMTEGEKSR